MAELNKKDLDLLNDEPKEVEFKEDSFKLVQADKKIYDQKFETKTTTFAKDALKRFAKNKSSVAGAIIIGILLLCAIFVPILSRAEIEDSRIYETFLAPKLFKSGTGFWDGTRTYKDVPFYKDEADGQWKPANFAYNAVSNVKVNSEPSYINKTNEYAKGGYFKFTNENDFTHPEDEFAIKFLRSDKFAAKVSDNLKLSIEFSNEDAVDAGELGEYQILLVYEEEEAGTTAEKSVVLQDWSKTFEKVDIDVSAKMGAAAVDNLAEARIEFRLKAGDKKQSYILMKNVILTSSSTNEEVVKHLEAVSIIDANRSAMKQTTAQGTDEGYWVSDGIKGVYKTQVYLGSFRYDTYAAVYDKVEKVIDVSTLMDYKRNGWCKVEFVRKGFKDYEIIFEKLSDECPIDSISGVLEYNPILGDPTTLQGEVYRYRELGYDKMPIFLFGTDVFGHDLFKKAFTGLRTSLILGICTAAFCLAFGLCWGAISGYFGGNVDLAMERFCEILGGVPWIVIMTLCILHLGNNFGTFFLALCLTGWLGVAARTRTQFYRFKGREYILASRTLGASDSRLIFKHILPNALGTIVTSSVLMIPSTIFSEATLAYLNLGLQDVQSFGVMMSDNQNYIETYPNLIVFPAVVMALIMISFNLFGNGLRDALNPSLKGSE